MMVTTTISANLADRIGRRRVLTIGSAAAVVAGIIAFPIIDIAAAPAFGVGLCLVLGVAGLTYGVPGAGISYNLAGEQSRGNRRW